MVIYSLNFINILDDKGYQDFIIPDLKTITHF